MCIHSGEEESFGRHGLQENPGQRREGGGLGRKGREEELGRKGRGSKK